jgi:hypothetical protein
MRPQRSEEPCAHPVSLAYPQLGRSVRQRTLPYGAFLDQESLGLHHTCAQLGPRSNR